MAFHLSRRAFLLLGGAGVGVAAVAGAGALKFALADPAIHVEQALRRLFGPFNMAPGDLAQFADDFNGMLAVKNISTTKVRVVAVAEAVDLITLAKRFGPETISDGAEKYDRELVTGFLTTTDFLKLKDPTVDRITYQGFSEACGNPFAVFDMADS
jgi:hypothetical protein